MIGYITSILLAVAINTTAVGVYNSDVVFLIIGGFCAGVYNAIIQQNNDD